ncbi:MAG: TolC family protein [Candidatus Binatia bacterium]
MGEQIDVKETPGEFQGGFLRQEIVTAGKLRLSRQKYLARASAAEYEALAQQYRVMNDVRIHFYRTLAAQERLSIQHELLKTAQDNVVTTREMFNVGQANRADLHLATITLEDQKLTVQMAENDRQMTWENLMAVVGIERPLSKVDGQLDGEVTLLTWDHVLAYLLEASPELASARAKLQADEITVQRERVEPIPNIVVEGAMGYNYEAREPVYGAMVVVEVPLFDRNQGTIRQAQADLLRQHAEVRRTELRLRRLLAEQYRQYRTAGQHVREYREVILPEAQARYVTRLESYREDRATWPEVLEAQKGFFLRRLLLVDHLLSWRESEVTITGLLLVNGLDAPVGVTPPGHIDAVPKPR